MAIGERARTADDGGGIAPHAPILATEKIGLTRRLTPEGFLLCEGVPIARTGWMMYGPGETPVKTGDHGIAMVVRDADTLFSPVTVASFVGKSVTNDHPQDGVSPDNWQRVTVGTVHNVRRGTGDQSNLLLADLLVTDSDAIRAIQRGKVEVSAGYDADYETTGPGEGRQLNIVGNHVALVDRGRCGPSCSIGDSATVKGTAMPTARIPARGSKPRHTISNALRKLMLDAAMEGMETALAEAPGMNMGEEEGEEEGGDGSHVHVHLHGGPGAPGKPAMSDDDADPMAAGEGAPAAAADPTEARFQALEKGHEEIKAMLAQLMKAAPGGGQPASEEGATGDDGDYTADPDEGDKGNAKGTGTMDSAALASWYQGVMADAEVLVPGFRVPTFDSRQPRKITVDSVCQLRRKALDLAATTEAGREVLQAVTGRREHTFDSMDCRAVATLFRAAAGAKRLANNRGATSDSLPGPAAAARPAPKGPMTPAELNALHRKLHAH